jgi:hypothetical protein
VIESGGVTGPVEILEIVEIIEIVEIVEIDDGQENPPAKIRIEVEAA